MPEKCIDMDAIEVLRKHGLIGKHPNSPVPNPELAELIRELNATGQLDDK